MPIDVTEIEAGAVYRTETDKLAVSRKLSPTMRVVIGCITSQRVPEYRTGCSILLIH